MSLYSRAVTLLVCLIAVQSVRLAVGAYFGDDCRERIPNGHRIPFQEHVAGYCSGEDSGNGTKASSCHGGALTMQSNPFGKDFAAAGYKWTTELCRKDSDEDGSTNGEELGDPCCVWRPGAEVPGWILNWPVTHPGFRNSTHNGAQNAAARKKSCDTLTRLKAKRVFHKGEGKLTLEYEMDEVPLLMNRANSTEDLVIFQNFVYNFPHDATYHIIGIERWFENEEFLKYTVKHEISTCPMETFEGPNNDLDSFADPCIERLYMWNMDNTSPFILPKSFSIRVGKGTRRLGFTARLVYWAPRRNLKSKSIRSGLRFHVTTTPRKHEVGVLRADFLMRPALIPSNSKVALSTLFQIKVDQSIARRGVKLLGYVPGHSQHYQTCRTWIERLNRTSGRTDIMHSLTELRRVEDLGRDVEWFNADSDIYLHNADYFSYTCMVDSSRKSSSIELERCHTTLYYYPADAMNQQIAYSGPVYITQLTSQESTQFGSVTDMFPLPSFDTKLPLWRVLYLNDIYKCDPNFNLGISNTSEATHGVSDKLFQLRAPCRKGKSLGDFKVTQGRLDYDCGKECAMTSFNVMGCALRHDAQLDNGKFLPLYPAPLEAITQKQCGKMFKTIYQRDQWGLENHLEWESGIFGVHGGASAISNGPSGTFLLVIALLGTITAIG